MSKRLILTTGLIAFGAGIAVGSGLPKSSQIFALLLGKLGIDLSDLLLTVWDPEKALREPEALPAPAARAARPRKPKRQAVAMPKVIVKSRARIRFRQPSKPAKAALSLA